MFYKRIIPFVLSFIFLAASIMYVSGTEKTTDSMLSDENERDEIITVEKPAEEIRGVWVTYMTLDVEDETDKENSFKEKINTIIEDMKKSDLNTMIVQARPFSDAIYPSKYYPWSHILTGDQGEDPGYDPLGYIIDRAHENDIMVHAWLNPYRISTKNTPSQLSDDNPYIRYPEMCKEVNGSVYLDPASEKAITLIADGAREIAEKYDVDGIQFDDYFYPPDCGDFDEDDYQAYIDSTDEPMTLEEFRKDNVSRMIERVYREIHKVKKDVMFGVSPQGNLGNNKELYADVEKWCSEKGYIDYICPQIYFSLDNPALTFEDGLKDWVDMEKHDGLSLYVGIPAYKAGTDADEGTWLDNSDILTTEIAITRQQKADGFMLYSYDSFHNEDNAVEVSNMIDYLTSSPTQ